MGLPADWSVVKWDGKKLAKKEDKLAKIVLGAAEQSKRNRVPEVHLFEHKAEFLKAFLALIISSLLMRKQLRQVS